jgi:hypothetical protein
MNIAGAPEGLGRALPARAVFGEEIRCPSCARLLVLRSGPAITPHFAHRPRQSCRNRPGRSPISLLRLEQLTLFDLEAPSAPAPITRPLAAPAPITRPLPAAPEPSTRPGRAGMEPERITHRYGGQTAPAPRRRRRRAWLPRLIRWIKAQARSD